MTTALRQPLHYARPRTLAEASERLLTPGAVIYAGGSDLLVAVAERGSLAENASTLIDIKALAEARGIERDGDLLRIGALGTAAELARDPLLRAATPALAEAALLTAAPALRHRATLGGNICTPHPAGDMTTALLALGAEIEIGDGRGRDIVPLAALLDGDRPLQAGEIVLAIRLRTAPQSAFAKFGPRLGFCRAITAAAVCRREGETGAALGGVAVRPARAPHTALALVSRGDLAGAIASDCDPPDDAIASRTYRLRLATTLMRRCWAAAGGEGAFRA